MHIYISKTCVVLYEFWSNLRWAYTHYGYVWADSVEIFILYIVHYANINKKHDPTTISIVPLLLHNDFLPSHIYPRLGQSVVTPSAVDHTAVALYMARIIKYRTLYIQHINIMCAYILTIYGFILCTLQGQEVLPIQHYQVI